MVMYTSLVLPLLIYSYIVLQYKKLLFSRPWVETGKMEREMCPGNNTNA